MDSVRNTYRPQGVTSRRFLPLACIVVLAGAASCIERIAPESIDFQELMVVEGRLTGQPGGCLVYLSRTRPLNSDSLRPERSAEVAVIDRDGNTHPLQEVSPGVYKSFPSFAGMFNEEYRLSIVTSRDERFESLPVTLKQTPPIDSVYFEASTRLTEVAGDTLTGITILLDTHSDSGGTRFYRWEWEETWEVRVPYPSKYDWELIQELPPSHERPGYEVAHNRPVEVCFSNRVFDGILVGDSKGLAQDRISKQEVTYVSTIGYKLNSMYSINVRQYVLDEQEYIFWSTLDKLSESLGTLFDPLPYQVTGNIFKINDADTPVLGYFGASSIEEQRIFISRQQLRHINYAPNPCIQEKLLVENKFVQNHIEAGYLIAALGPYGSLMYELAPAACCDCTYHGTLEKPEFWPY